MHEKFYVKEAVTESDFSLCVDLWTENLRLSLEECHAKLKWFYLSDEVVRSRVWLLVDKSTDVAVGVGGVSYRFFSDSSGSIKAKCGLLADLAIDSKHRSLGPGIFFQKQILEIVATECDFVYAFPNKGASAIFKRIGYERISGCEGVKILDYCVYLKKRTKNGFLLWGIGGLLNLFLSIKRNTFLRLNSGYIGKSVADLSLNKRTISGYPNILCPMKDEKIIKWRYADNYEHNYRFHSASSPDDGIESIIIYYVTENMVIVVDIINLRDHSKISFKKFFRYCQSKHYFGVYFYTFGNDLIMNYARKAGFRVRESSRSVYLYKTNQDLNSDLLFMLGDEDNN